MTILIIVVVIGFLACLYFLRQIVFYLARCTSQLAEIDASLSVVILRLEALYSPLESIEDHLDPNNESIE